MHDSVVGQVLHRLQHAVHVVLDLDQRHVVQVGEEGMTLLVPEHQRYLAVEPVALY